MARPFFQASWGFVRLWISRISTSEGRKQVIQQFTSGDVPDVKNVGNVPKVVKCSLMFDQMLGDTTDPIERLENLIALKDRGKPQVFSHPIHGTFLAEIEDFEHTIDSHGVITAEASFIATEAVGSFAVVPISTLEVDADVIATRADQLTAELADVDSISALPAAAKKASTVFDDAKSARDVLVEISSTSDRIWQEVQDGKLEADVALWPAMKAYVMLGEAVRAGGAVAMGDVPLMTTRVDGPMSLRRLMAEVYGAEEAEDRGIEARELNDIPTPGRLTTGMLLRLRQPTSQQRAA